MSSVSNSACHEQCHHDSGTTKHHLNMDTDLHDKNASLFQADKENLHVLLYEECLGKVLLETHKPAGLPVCSNYFHPALNTMQSVCQKIFICGLVNTPHFHLGLRVWSGLSSILIFAFFFVKWSKFTEEKSKEKKSTFCSVNIMNVTWVDYGKVVLWMCAPPLTECSLTKIIRAWRTDTFTGMSHKS